MGQPCNRYRPRSEVERTRDTVGGAERAQPRWCPREVRLLLSGPLYHDLDFVNSLPTVASQLDALGLCPSGHLTLLRHYCTHRSSWFDDIIAWHARCSGAGQRTIVARRNRASRQRSH